MSVVVALPTRDRADLAYKLAKWLLADHPTLQIIVADNGAPRAPMIDLEHLGFDTGRLLVLHARHHDLHGKIYRLWNWCWDAALASTPGDEPLDVAFVNDDAWPSPGCLGELSRWLRELPDAGIVYPDYLRPALGVGVQHAMRPTRTHGTYRNGGMCGWCFMVRGELRIRFDETYEWFCGDDRFAYDCERTGWRQYRVNGVGVDHLGEATSVLHDWTHAAKARDLERFQRETGRP